MFGCFKSSSFRQTSSAPRQDSSAPRQDSSAPRRDSSAPRQDSSAPRQDSSAPRQDSSTPRQDSSTPRQDSSAPSIPVRRLNDSVYQLHKPQGTPSLQFVFFHGLYQQNLTFWATVADDDDAHFWTWASEDKSCLWPQTWLVKHFPASHILTVSYETYLVEESFISPSLWAESLLSDLLQANIGQEPDCSLIFVGHSFGGLLIKQLLCEAHQKLNDTSLAFKDAKLEPFLNNVRGIFYYATPHHGSGLIERWDDSNMPNRLEKCFKSLNKDATRWTNRFDEMSKVHYDKCVFGGLGETLGTKMARCRSTEGSVNLFSLSSFTDTIVTPEESAMNGNFSLVQGTDHFSICRPRNENSRSFYQLKNFVGMIANAEKERRTRAEDNFQEDNFQHMPKFVIGIDIQAKRIRDKLQNIPTVCLVGTRGVGKTTLAMAVFNELLPQFEYSCFVPDVKGIKGSIENLLDLVWKQMHYKGRKVQQQPDWSKLKGERVLLALDNISDDRDRKVLSEIIDTAATDSRFILTSCDAEFLQTLGDVCNVPLLENDSAEQLFKGHALPNYTIPSFTEFSRVIKAIVKHCEGLPRTLEVLGKYLGTKESEKDWEQVLHSLNEAQERQGIEGRAVKLRLFYEGLPEEEREIYDELIRGGQPFKKLNENEDIYNLYEDPLTYEEMCDPVMCSDGRTYDRWTIIDQRITRSPFDRNVTGFAILCDNIDVRRKVFEAFPEQENKFRNRRQKFRDEALQHARASPVEVEDALEKFNNVLKWKPVDNECQEERNRILMLVSQKNRFPQEMVPSPEISEDSLSTAPAVRVESQSLPPERPEDVLPTVLAGMEDGQTSRIPVSTQEVPAYEIPEVNHEDLMRARASDFETRLPILLVFSYIIFMGFLI